MRDCEDEVMRDRLPLLQRGVLAQEEAAAVQRHLEGCASCRAERDALRRAMALFDAATPAVDVTRIVAALPAAPGARPALRVERGGQWLRRRPRYLWAAAASVVLIGSLTLARQPAGFFGKPAASGAGVDSATDARGPASLGTLVASADLSELDAESLETLLAELEALEATVTAEPTLLQAPVVSAPEGL